MISCKNSRSFFNRPCVVSAKLLPSTNGHPPRLRRTPDVVQPKNCGAGMALRRGSGPRSGKPALRRTADVSQQRPARSLDALPRPKGISTQGVIRFDLGMRVVRTKAFIGSPAPGSSIQILESNGSNCCGHRSMDEAHGREAQREVPLID